MADPGEGPGGAGPPPYLFGNSAFSLTNESKGPRTKMLLVYVGATDSSDQPKIKYKDNKLQGWHYVEMKVKNANSGQLFRPDWVSSEECMPHRIEQLA